METGGKYRGKAIGNWRQKKTSYISEPLGEILGRRRRKRGRGRKNIWKGRAEK